MAGRPPKTLDDEQRAQLEALAAYLTQDQIADYFGITRQTLAAMCERDEDISLRYKRGKAKAIAKVAHGCLAAALSGSAADRFFYLKTQAGWRETNRTELTGKDGGPLEVTGEAISDEVRQALDTIAGKITSSSEQG